MNRSLLLLFFTLACFCISGITGYTVQGNKVIDPNGKQVLIRGVDRPSFEWNQIGEQASLADYTLMKNWGSNCVRISLNQDFWFASASYAATIDQQIAWVRSLGMGVILDLHWNNGQQQNMADRNSITFWSQVGARYKNNLWVIFELYNEPHDVSWSQWLRGDATYAGMQEMYNAVRAAGASNMVLVCGLNWAFDLSGVGNGYAVVGTNIGYATHPYDYPGKQAADWHAAFGFLAATAPIVMTEFGQYCATGNYVADLLAYAQNNGIHWTAWAWYVNGCSFPSIISDWAGTPAPGVGVIVKQYLSGNAPVIPSTTGSVASSSTTGAPSTGAPPAAAGTLTLFADGLASGWQDWSWATGYSISDTTYVRAGSKSIKFPTAAYGGIYLHATSAVSIGSYSTIQFYANGGAAAVSASALSVKIYGAAGTVIASVNFPASVPASQWSLMTVPISSFGVASDTAVTGIAITSNAAASVGTVWLDDIALVPASSSNTATPAPTLAPTSAPTQKPTTTPAPTQKPATTTTTTTTTTGTNTPKPTTTTTTAAPTTAASTPAPTTTTKPSTTTGSSSSGCDASSVQITQTQVGSWQSGSQTVTQYTVTVSTTCAGKKLVGMTVAASNWNPSSFWNVLASGTGTATLTLPGYASVSSTAPYSVGYQNVGGQANFVVTSVTFQ